MNTKRIHFSYLLTLIVLFIDSLFQNIMLKVEVESLKKELEEKQQFLDQALWVSAFFLHGSPCCVTPLHPLSDHDCVSLWTPRPWTSKCIQQITHSQYITSPGQLRPLVLHGDFLKRLQGKWTTKTVLSLLVRLFPMSPSVHQSPGPSGPGSSHHTRACWPIHSPSYHNTH